MAEDSKKPGEEDDPFQALIKMHDEEARNQSSIWIKKDGITSDVMFDRTEPFTVAVRFTPPSNKDKILHVEFTSRENLVSLESPESKEEKYTYDLRVKVCEIPEEKKYDFYFLPRSIFPDRHYELLASDI